MAELLPPELTRRAFRSANGEFGWSRAEARTAITFLSAAEYAVLGGELWWVPDGAREWIGWIPQKNGPDAVYPWETERGTGESWQAFVDRCAQESIDAVERWPDMSELPDNLGGRILYNLTWVSEEEYQTLGEPTV